MLYNHRPDWLKTCIYEEFERISSEELIKNYTFNGQGSYEFLAPTVNSFALIRAKELELNRKLRILDVGAGAGFIILNALAEGHDAQGISAIDYRDTELGKDLDDAVYKVCDAHNLIEIPGLLTKFDVVLSRWTLRHLLDPLSVIEQMASLVGDGGVIAFDATNRREVDYLTVYGTQYGTKDFFYDMCDAGFSSHPFTDHLIGHYSTNILPFMTPDFVANRSGDGLVEFNAFYGEHLQR